MDNRTKILIAFPLVLVIILVIAARLIPLRVDPSEVETQMLEFAPHDLNINEEQKVQVSWNLTGPFDFNLTEEGQSGPGVAHIYEGTEYNNSDLTFTVVTDRRKAAIIKGMLFSEGDVMGDSRISRIEPGRVLLENKHSKWLYLEK